MSRETDSQMSLEIEKHVFKQGPLIRVKTEGRMKTKKNPFLSKRMQTHGPMTNASNKIEFSEASPNLLSPDLYIKKKNSNGIENMKSIISEEEYKRRTGPRVFSKLVMARKMQKK